MTVLFILVSFPCYNLILELLQLNLEFYVFSIVRVEHVDAIMFTILIYLFHLYKFKMLQNNDPQEKDQLKDSLKVPRLTLLFYRYAYLLL